jgi:hypothetical protein
MDLIRDANPYPEGLPPLPIEPVMQRLAEAGSSQPAAKRRIPLPNVGAVIAAVSVLVALAIAVVAVTTLGHRPQTTVTATSPVTSSRHELLQTLGVLRRPQTRTDLLAARPGGEGGELPGLFQVSTTRGACRGRNSSLLPCTLRLDKPLVRAVKIGDGYRAAIFPTKIERSTAQAQRGEGVVIALRGPGLYIIDSMTPTSTQALRNHGLLLSAYVASGVDRGVMLVPDGVAEITLDHFRLLGPRMASLGQVPPTTSTVTDNVALLQITGLTEHDLHLNPHTLGRYFHEGSGHGCQTTFAVYSLPATAQMTWLSPGHTPIRRITINLRLDVGTHRPAPGTTEPFRGCPR